jgi:hypothetical protein
VEIRRGRPGRVAVTVNREVALPAAFSLSEATPNPSTTIAYQVPEQTNITMTIYNLLGQNVIRVMNQVQAAGRYEAVWCGLSRVRARFVQAHTPKTPLYIFTLLVYQVYPRRPRRGCADSSTTPCVSHTTDDPSGLTQVVRGFVQAIPSVPT